MPWCSKCGAEYVDGVETCTTCKVPLKPAPMLATAPDDESEWVLLTTFPDPMQAKALSTTLKSAGIPSSVRDRNQVLGSLYGFGKILENGHEVYVNTDRLEKAKKLITGQVEWTDEDLTEYMERTGDLEKESDDDEELIGV